MRTRDRMKPLVAAAVLGFPIAIAGPAVAQDGSYAGESLMSAGIPTVEGTYPASVVSDGTSTLPAKATAPDARQEGSPGRPRLPGNADPGGVGLPSTEHIALIALALLSVGAGIFTVATEKRRVLTQPD